MKLSQLTPEQKTQMLAELDTSERVEAPSYLTSYDAIIPLIKKQPKWIQLAIAKRFYACDCPVLENMAVMLTATPSQLFDAVCDVVLVATGKAEL